MQNRTVKDRSPTDTAFAYFERIRGRDPGVSELFHENGELIGLGRVTSGRQAIHDFYAASIAHASPTPELVGDLLVSGSRVAAEIEIALSDGSMNHVVDMFVVEDGLIRSLTYFVCEH